ncbi:MAG: glycosyltransferase [Desulfobacteraceae bacterium]|nr:glycosyltransferase [Desulfobacteraceae bacterium]
MKKLKLLFLDFEVPYLLKDTDYNVGGACVQQLALAKGLTSLGHKVGILTWKGAKEYIEKGLEFDIIETYTLAKGIKKLRFFYYQFPALFIAVKNYHPDFLVQKCPGDITGVVALISKILDIPFVYMAKNDIDADGRYINRYGFITSKIYEYGIRNAGKLIVQNEYQMKEFDKRLKNKDISVVHEPVEYDVDKLEEVSPLEYRKYVAWLGVFQYQKNLPALLDIAKKTPEMEFRIGGRLPDIIPDEIKAAAGQLSIQPNVKMLGYLKRGEIQPFLANAITLLNTSYYEGFPSTFLESWLAGTPVVTRGFDPDNIIRKNGIGTVAEQYGHIPDILRSYANSKNYRSISEKCRKYVIKYHNPRTIAERFIDSLPLRKTQI